MAYYCEDCSYRGVKSGQLGECPACGSFNIIKHALQLEKQPPPAKWRLVVLVVLWGCFIVLIAEKVVR